MKSLLALLMLAVWSASAAAQSARSLDALTAPSVAMQAPSLPVVVRADVPAGRAEPDGLIPASWRPRSTVLNWIDYSLIAATGVAAVVAIHYKFEADERYAEYQQTGDPALRSDIQALDRRSGIALIGMQAGVTVFAVRLLLR